MISLNEEHIVPQIGRDKLLELKQKAQWHLRTLLRRECRGSEMLGWLDLPNIKKKEIEKITDTAKRIQDNNDCLVVVGIGGSYLGARSAISALEDEAPFPVYFAGTNLSPEYHLRLLSKIEGKRFALCVISKSGTTTESAIAFRIFREKLLDSVGEEILPHKIIAITDPVKGALRKMAETQGYTSFEIPPDVGGRFSVLSPVGLVPIAISGININELIEGAKWALGRFSSTDTLHEAISYSALRFACHEMNFSTEVMSTFHPELEDLLEWWKQLAGESEGKSHKGLFPASTIMTRDLHSLGQYLQEGKRNILETFLTAKTSKKDIIVPFDTKDLDGLNYLADRPLSEINRKALEGTVSAHADGGIGVIKLEFDEISPYYLGAIYLFFEISIAVSALMLDLNPFDQPGVEEYKKRMFKLLGKPGY